MNKPICQRLAGFTVALCLTVFLGSGCSEVNKADSISIRALQSAIFEASLKLEKKLSGTEDYSADLMSYYSDDLKIFTLVNTPASPMPEKGFPVLIFGHGYHPEPEKYGISKDTGKDARPGDYYRGVPEHYAEQGFMVFTPDYRGHNRSEGFEYTRTQFLASSYYAVDVLYLIAALSSLEDANLERVYYMGHSMGGDVGLKVLLSNKTIRAASLWAPVVAGTYEQAFYYNGYYGDKFKAMPDVDNEVMEQYMLEIDRVYKSLPFKLRYEEVDPIYFINEISVPLIIHHAVGDVAVPYMWSERLVTELFKYGKAFNFFRYDSNNHMLQGDNRMLAIDRDIAFFKAH